MKTISFLAAVLFSVSASASHWGTYTAEESSMSTALLRTCPAEAVQIMKSSKYVMVDGGEYVGGMSPSGVSTTYHFYFKVMNDSGEAKIVTLVANENIDADSNITAKCEVVSDKVEFDY